MEELLRDATNRAIKYLETLPGGRVAPCPSAFQGLGGFATPLPEQPLGPAEILEELDTLGSPATVGSAGGRYFGFVIGGSLPATLAANVLAGAWSSSATSAT